MAGPALTDPRQLKAYLFPVRSRKTTSRHRGQLFATLRFLVGNVMHETNATAGAIRANRLGDYQRLPVSGGGGVTAINSMIITLNWSRP
jgi:hypothetical protein